MIEMAGRQRTSRSSSSSIQSPLRPDAEIGIKSDAHNSVRTTRLSASSRICFRVHLPPLLLLTRRVAARFVSFAFDMSPMETVRFIRTTFIPNMCCALSCCAMEHRSSLFRQVQVLIRHLSYYRRFTSSTSQYPLIARSRFAAGCRFALLFRGRAVLLLKYSAERVIIFRIIIEFNCTEMSIGKSGIIKVLRLYNVS